ncbi:MAG: pyruvate kinase [Candidatus Buchananbacteria bacterium CG10_big_fil_rev_8_21_14_0_10_42_9]|uniref:Pyruvate kinase n=1 Tax=Candidatus Buchananbacteria bacterium CG10_big_fil_rev_8_21_14_0_10_42_9 TaxID=1974526 RepID=A0A2H0W1R7_9BACT|nr:MAG: pyruvate kinase [Candidatus Buchananbacteria bacterium CG10_big_fil_rev_8_21_14_0_10_42_9]
MKRTKIVCTIGPASETQATIERLISAGMNVARLNFSHNVHSHHAMLIKNIRAASKKKGVPVAILQDLQGPRIRIGKLPEDGIELKKGNTITLTPKAGKLSDNIIPIQLPSLYKYVKAGHSILIDDALLQLKVTGVSKPNIKARVVVGGILKSNKGMNFPNSSIKVPAVTTKDKRDLVFGIKQNVDFVALSFVSKAEEIVALRKQIVALEKKFGWERKNNQVKAGQGERAPLYTRIIAKIERKEALQNFDEILAVADGIMIARGDLGIELPIQDLPLFQKRFIQKCNKAGKPVIVATQMLDSMIQRPVPTRAEVSDIANAILDGTDAIMLSGETATGKYPLKAVQVMNKVAQHTEPAEIKLVSEPAKRSGQGPSITESTTLAAETIAEMSGAKVIVCSTAAGFAVRSVIRNKPRFPVVAVTAFEKTQRQLSLSWGVSAFVTPPYKKLSELISYVNTLLKEHKLAKSGDRIVICSSHPYGYIGHANLIKIETVK